MCRGGVPQQLVWRGRAYRVLRPTARWVVRGHWWTTEVQRHYVSVVTDGGYFILYHDAHAAQWYLALEQD